MSQLVDLGVDLGDFDGPKSLTLWEALPLMQGRKGPPAYDVASKWTRAHFGCRPRGPDGPVIVLPVLKISGVLRTMPAWIEAFERARQRIGQRVMEAAPAAPLARPPRRRKASQRQAARILDAAGI